MNTIDKQYQDLLQTILDYGVEKKDRTGTGTKSIFGYTIRHNMKDGFPLLTTKKMAWKTLVTELIWFLRGDTNIKFLVDNGCHIWDGDAYKRYTNHFAGHEDIPSKDWFINEIKTNNEFANKWGNLGSIYGKQWRSWGKKTVIAFGVENWIKGTDQIENLINDLKTNPDSRRLMVSAWNVGELDQMVLPPCHYGFQVYTRELSDSEIVEHYYNRIEIQSKWKKDDKGRYFSYDEKENIWFEISGSDIHFIMRPKCPTRAISLMWNQRSVDTFLGLPFNIASYGLLLEIIAKAVNMVPGQLIGNLGDVHLYSNHIEQAKEQIGRKYTHEERVELLKTAMGEERYNQEVSELVPFGGGMSEFYDIYKIPTHTREPYPLPTLKIESEVKWNEGDCLPYYSPSDFTIENYQSYPTIKAPLSN